MRPRFQPPGPALSARWTVTLASARAPHAVVGDRLPQVVKDASKADRTLITSTAERAIGWLASNPRVPIEKLYALAIDVLSHVRALRGIPAPDLRSAMRREEAANAALNIAQWAAEGPLTLGRLHELRRDVGVQIVASLQLLQAIDQQIAQQDGSHRPQAPRSPLVA